MNEAAALELFNSSVMSPADFNKPALLAPPEPTIDYPMQLTYLKAPTAILGENQLWATEPAAGAALVNTES